MGLRLFPRRACCICARLLQTIDSFRADVAEFSFETIRGFPKALRPKLLPRVGFKSEGFHGVTELTHRLVFNIRGPERSGNGSADRQANHA